MTRLMNPEIDTMESINTETSTHLTSNEIAYIKAILNDDFCGGDIQYNLDGTPEGDVMASQISTWAWSPAEEFGKSAGGIAASLANKELICCSGRGRDATINLTVKGCALVRELGLV